MKKSEEQVQNYLTKIRQIISKEKLMPLRTLQIRLNKTGTHLDLHYISKLRKQVRQELLFKKEEAHVATG